MIQNAHATVASKTENQARKHFITIIQKLTLYGNHFFDIKSTSDKRLPNGGILCINYQGVKIMDPTTRVRTDGGEKFFLTRDL